MGKKGMRAGLRRPPLLPAFWLDAAERGTSEKEASVPATETELIPVTLNEVAHSIFLRSYVRGC